MNNFIVMCTNPHEPATAMGPYASREEADEAMRRWAAWINDGDIPEDEWEEGVETLTIDENTYRVAFLRPALTPGEDTEGALAALNQ